MPSGVYIRTKENKQNISLANKDRIPWNKGLTKEIDERMQKIANKLKGNLNCLGKSSGMKGKQHSLKTKQKMSLAHRNRIITWGDKISKSLVGKKLSKEHRKKISKSRAGKTYEEIYGSVEKANEMRKKVSLALKRNWKNIEYAKKIFLHKIPSSFEQKIIDLVGKYNLPYKFVGDGKISIGGKIPDFIHTNNKKIVIETYGIRHKQAINKCFNYEEVRNEHFAKYNYKVIFLNEHDLFRNDFEQHCLAKLKK